MFRHSRTRIFSFIIILMLLTDIVVLLDVPFLRPFLAFIFFTFVPGLLILQLLKINLSNVLKRFILSVGLSVSFLMLIGLVLNSLYPYILKPLSLYPLLISLNLLVAILSVAAYKKNNGFNVLDFNLNLNFGDNLISVIIFPILFPLLAILGTYLMNTQGNNIILLLLMFIIPAYIVVIIYLRDRLNDLTYPVALWMIGFTLFLIHGLTSFYLVGRDIHQEFYCFQLTLENFHWSLSNFYDPYNACISINILPTIYQVLLNINPEYVFKLVFALIGSIIPMTIYFVFKKFIGKTYAFYASLFIIFQIFFIFLMGAVRQEIAFIFFFLAVMVYFDAEIDKNPKKIIFLILMFSVLISHYTTAYIAITLMILVLLSPFVKDLIIKRKINFVNFDLILIMLCFTFLWYIFAAQVQFESGASAVTAAVSSTNTSPNGTQGGSSLLLAVFGIGLKSNANWISVIVNDLTFIFIGIGLLTITWKFKYYIRKMGIQYLAGIYASILLLVTVVLVPFASQLYGAERLFIQILIFLAPVFVIGANSIAKLIKMPKGNHIIILAILISLFVCTTNLHAHFMGEPYSPYFENDGGARNEYYIYQPEVVGAQWIMNYGINNTQINTDYTGGSRLSTGFGTQRYTSSYSFLIENKTPPGYVYLINANVNKQVMYKDPYELRNINKRYMDEISIKNFIHLFKQKNRIYENGFVEIYY